MDQKIAADKANDPYRWRRVICVPLTSYSTMINMNTLWNNTEYRKAYITQLPLAINLTQYVYEFRYTACNLTSSRTTDYNADLQVMLGYDSLTSTRNFEDVANLYQTKSTKTAGSPGDWLNMSTTSGFLFGSNAVNFYEGLKGQTASPYYSEIPRIQQYTAQIIKNITKRNFPYIAFESTNHYLYGQGIWFEYRAIYSL